MALIFAGSKCALCGALLGSGTPLFATSGVFVDPSDPLFRFCDAGMHWDCYARWSDRSRFARAYFDSWIVNAKHNPFWGTVYESERVLVTVNPRAPVEKFSLVIAATGTHHFVKLGDWGDFLTNGPGTFPHPVEQDVIADLLPELRILGTDPGPLIDGALFPPPPAEDIARVESRRKLRTFNRAARRTARQVTEVGAGCPHCGSDRREHAFHDGSSRHSASFFVCAGCARSFTHEQISS